MTRAVLLSVLLALPLAAQESQPPAPPAAPSVQEQEPPEEDPDLKPKDIAEALHYAAEALRERELPLRSDT